MTTRPAGDLVVVLCKPPTAKHAKTRLRRDIGDLDAERVYTECLISVIRAALDTTATVRLAVHGSPEELLAALPRVRPTPPAHRQVGDTFAARQANELRTGLARGHRVVTVVGSDLVGLTAANLVACQDIAAAGDLGLLLAPDGGYAALSASRPFDELADVPMSVPDTARQLIRCAGEAGHRIEAVPDVEIPDIDTGADLEAHPRPA
ncbi:TIGR04282 family arsenosugar biosynthesis glycosyltransferase [Actinophytocola sediminis]